MQTNKNSLLEIIPKLFEENEILSEETFDKIKSVVKFDNANIYMLSPEVLEKIYPKEEELKISNILTKKLFKEEIEQSKEIANNFNDIDDIYENKSGCTFVNMYDISTGILAKKTANNTNDKRYQYIDISANYTNHPNDFMIRLYAGAILSTFIDF